MTDKEMQFEQELKALQKKYGIVLEAVLIEDKPANGFLTVKAAIGYRTTNGRIYE